MHGSYEGGGRVNTAVPTKKDLHICNAMAALRHPTPGLRGTRGEEGNAMLCNCHKGGREIFLPHFV